MNELSMNGLLGSRWKYVDSRPSRGYGNTLLLDGKGFFPCAQAVRTYAVINRCCARPDGPPRRVRYWISCRPGGCLLIGR